MIACTDFIQAQSQPEYQQPRRQSALLRAVVVVVVHLDQQLAQPAYYLHYH